MSASDGHQMANVHLLEVDGGPPVTRATVADPFRVLDDTVVARVDGADYRVVPRLDDAHIAALPAHWDTYDGPARRRALDAVEAAGRAGLKTIVWVVGDAEASFSSDDVLAFHLGARRTRPRRSNAVECYPVFVEDRHDPDHRPLQIDDRPRLGFCGQAATNAGDELRRLTHKMMDRGRHSIGRHDRWPAPLASHVRLRERTLDIATKSDLVDTDFIVRSRYRAGVAERSRRLDPAEPTNLDFVRNIQATDYTICMRGGGNFSARLYETLMHGRIPIVVDSGARLPLEDDLDWDSVGIIVPEAELERLPAIVRERHDDAGAAGVRAWQQRCRNVWREWLSLDGYFGRFGATSRRHGRR